MTPPDPDVVDELLSWLASAINRSPIIHCGDPDIVRWNEELEERLAKLEAK